VSSSFSGSNGFTSPSRTSSAEYGDEISLVAIHSNLVTDDVDKFLAKENLDMPFALDSICYN